MFKRILARLIVKMKILLKSTPSKTKEETMNRERIFFFYQQKNILIIEYLEWKTILTMVK